MDSEAARSSFATAQFARLATADADGRPHIVPITFALANDTVYFAVDHKPKKSKRLKRIANIEANPHVSVLADHTDADWGRLWWARGDGRARVLGAGAEREAALRILADRYPQYAQRPPDGPLVAIAVHHWSGWTAS